MSETNYERYFGDTEAAAVFIERITRLCYAHKCERCPLRDGDCTTNETIFEWLEREAE